MPAVIALMKTGISGEAAAKVRDADVVITDALGEHRESLPIRTLSGISKLGDQPELRLISATFIAIGLAANDRRLSRAGVRMLVAHELATLAKDFIKDRIDRTRPRNARARQQAAPRPGRRKEKAHTSFPSGHSAGAVAVAQAFAREFPEHRAAALAAGGLVAMGQVPKNAHYPTDVAAGAALGAASEALVAAVWPARRRRNAVNDV